jgi:hypothetical protein
MRLPERRSFGGLFSVSRQLHPAGSGIDKNTPASPNRMMVRAE